MPDNPSQTNALTVAANAIADAKDKYAKLPGFDHGAAAAQLRRNYAEANQALRVVVGFGLFIFELQELHLKHGQFGPWLAKYAPEFCRPADGNKAPKESWALWSYKQITRTTLEICGLTVEKALSLFVSKGSKYRRACPLETDSTQPVLMAGQILLLPEEQIPEKLRPIRRQICEVIDGKTARQLMLEFKSVEEDGEGNLKVKPGRRKGEGGASHEQRAAAQAREEVEEREKREARMLSLSTWLIECADDEHWGKDDDEIVSKFAEAVASANSYLANLLEARANARKKEVQ